MNRYCESCKHDHGPLYVCPSYDADTKAEIAAQSERWIANLQDPAWIKSQLDKGVEPGAIAIFQAMAGL